jgi:hypothetical protein
MCAAPPEEDRLRRSCATRPRCARERPSVAGVVDDMWLRPIELRSFDGATLRLRRGSRPRALGWQGRVRRERARPVAATWSVWGDSAAVQNLRSARILFWGRSGVS